MPKVQNRRIWPIDIVYLSAQVGTDCWSWDLFLLTCCPAWTERILVGSPVSRPASGVCRRFCSLLLGAPMAVFALTTGKQALHEGSGTYLVGYQHLSGVSAPAYSCCRRQSAQN